MSEFKFKTGGCAVEGTCYNAAGELSDFSGTLPRNYRDCVRASVAARRVYHDPSISVHSIKSQKHTYVCDYDQLMSISTCID